MQQFMGQRSLLLSAMMAAMPAMAETNNYSSPLVFDQVVVTATKTENSIADAPASISVVTSEDIMEQPSMSLNQMVEHAVGVESRTSGGGTGRETISIRGMDSSYTLIMVNGRKISSSNAIIQVTNDFDLSAIPKENIERIEIIRGPMSALYGSEALGGVVNIITRVPDNKWRSTINADFATPADGDGGNETMLGVNTGGALIDNELYLNLAINKSDRDAWTPYSGTLADATALEERDTLSMTGGLNWYINDKHALDLDLSYSDDKRASLGIPTAGQAPRKGDSEVKRNNIALTHTGSWDFGESQLRVYRDQVEFDSYNTKTIQWDKVTETNYTLDGSLSTDLGDHRLTVGGDLRKTELDNAQELTMTGQAEVTQQALFVQDEWQLAEHWSLTYGGRADHHENFGTHFSPRAYLVHNATDQLTLKGGVGTAFKAPSLLQLSEEFINDSCQGRCQIIGNPDLKPETSTSYELAANYQQDNWEAEAALFRNDIKDLIQRDLPSGGLDSIPPGSVYTYENVEKALVQGIELGGRIALTRAFSLNADYTYTHAKDETTGDRLTLRPRQNASAKLNWQTSDKLTAFTRISYIGNQKISDELELGGYSTIDLGMNYAMSDTLKLRAGVTNLSNKQLSDQAVESGYTEDPRTWYAGFTYNF